jgi:hypothetical protein
VLLATTRDACSSATVSAYVHKLLHLLLLHARLQLALLGCGKSGTRSVLDSLIASWQRTGPWLSRCV